jgi:hypothetical protein
MLGLNTKPVGVSLLAKRPAHTPQMVRLNVSLPEQAHTHTVFNVWRISRGISARSPPAPQQVPCTGCTFLVPGSD